MPEFGFPAQPQISRMNRLVANMRRDGDAAQIATVTGRPADLAASLDGRVNEVMLIEKALSDLAGYADAIALTEARAGVTQRSLDRLVGIGQELADSVDVLLTNGTAHNLEIVSGEGRAGLESIVSALNARFAGRAVFAGDSGDGNAVADASTIFSASVTVLETAPTAVAAYSALEVDFMTPGGLFDTMIFTGGNGNAPRSEIAPGELVDHSVRADEDPMRRVIMNTVIVGAAYDQTNAIPDPIRRQLIELGSLGLRNAIDDIINVQGRLGTAEARIATVKARNIAEEAALGIRFNELAGADRYKEAFRLSEIETQLETALVTTARLSNLSLANYL